MFKKNWTAVAADSGCDICPAMESVHHILLHCRAASSLWQHLQLAALAGRAPDILSFVRQAAAQLQHKRKWNVAFAACAISLWHARNDRVFNSRSWTDAYVRFHAADMIRLWSYRARKLQDKEDLKFWGNLVAT